MVWVGKRVRGILGWRAIRPDFVKEIRVRVAVSWFEVGHVRCRNGEAVLCAHTLRAGDEEGVGLWVWWGLLLCVAAGCGLLWTVLALRLPALLWRSKLRGNGEMLAGKLLLVRDLLLVGGRELLLLLLVWKLLLLPWKLLLVGELLLLLLLLSRWR